ncbi:hypothetical protein [uncultured Methanobacterium sp.]|uniref:hypothetical protein n=1 Tax=uncultured Methanobacterium sp. TaxID=176306 RepID=UPI002AA8380C|nr:hypothetical protein [uncultured Methanobacterium sp.]
MDDKGFIFTADATLALVVVIVITASILVYALLPIYQGQEHQHLEMLADSALAAMEENGTFDYVQTLYAANRTEEANGLLLQSLNSLIPANEGIAYKLTMGSNVVENDSDQRYHALRSDVVTRVKVYSLPEEGWKARAYYKLEEVKFNDVNQTTITTVWNFHNYLAAHFAPWQYVGKGTGYGTLQNHNFWGGTNSPASGSNTPAQTSQNIQFNIPSTGTINSAKFLVGAMNDSDVSGGSERAYSTNLTINNNFYHFVQNSSFTYLYTRSGGNGKVYNYMGNILNTELNTGTNNFFLRYYNASYESTNAYSDMPWFSIIANYTTNFKVPEGVITTTSYFDDIAGVGSPSRYGDCINYSLNTGSTTHYTGRTTSWGTLQGSDFNTVFPGMGDNIPFAMTGMTGINDASCVATESDVYVPPGNNILDSYVVINGYGGCDGAIVQVKRDGGTWQTVFTSFGTGYTTSQDGANGYGNLPGTIALQDSYNPSKQYLSTGHNTVRVILYDMAESQDYDLVGLTNCYAVTTYTPLSIGWDTVTFNSYQNRTATSGTKTYTQTQNFTIKQDADSAFLFQGVGLDTRKVDVKLSNKTASTLIYSGSGLNYINLGMIDWFNQSTHIITSGVDANGTPILKPGQYNLTVTVTPSLGYESGDYPGTGDPQAYTNYADPEIFSGTRIGVIYPHFLQNSWSLGYGTTPDAAKYSANQSLQQDLRDTHITVTQDMINKFKYEVMYSGDVPTATPVRLELWKQ